MRGPKLLLRFLEKRDSRTRKKVVKIFSQKVLHAWENVVDKGERARISTHSRRRDGKHTHTHTHTHTLCGRVVRAYVRQSACVS